LELAKIITHYDFLSHSKPKSDLTLKTWTHLLDLVFDLDSLTRPLSQLEKFSDTTITNLKTFSEITEDSQESKASIQSQKQQDSESKSKSENNSKRNNSDVEIQEIKINLEENQGIQKSNMIEEFSEEEAKEKNEKLDEKDERNEKLDEKDQKLDEKDENDVKGGDSEFSEEIKSTEKEKKNTDNYTASSPSTHTFLQNKLKRREVIQGKVINEFSINSIDRQSLTSLSDFENNEQRFGNNGDASSEIISPLSKTIENRIKRQEQMIKTKSSVFEENMKTFEGKSSQTDIFSCLIEVLLANLKENLGKNDLKVLLEKKEELLFFNEELFDDDEGENDDEDQQIMVLLTKKKKGIFQKIFEKIKVFFHKNPQASIFLNGYSINILRVLSHSVKVLEVLQVSSLNLHLISQDFNIETIEFLLQFSSEILNHQFLRLSSLDRDSLKSMILIAIDTIILKSRRVICYLPFKVQEENQDLMILLKSFVYFFNINVLFSRKELKLLLNKYKTHPLLEPYSFEQQLYIISHKMANMLRFVIFSSKEDYKEISSNFKTFLKVFLRPGNQIFENFSLEFNLILELPIEKANKISFFQFLEAEFAQSFKDFHGFSLKKNPDFDKLLIKYLDGEIEKFMDKRLNAWKNKEIPGKLLDIFNKKDEKFKQEIKEIEEKILNISKLLDSAINEELDLKNKSLIISEEVETLKRNLEYSEQNLSELDQKFSELYNNSKTKRHEILQKIKNINDFEHDFLDESFEKSETFSKIAMVFWLIFKKTANAIGSPLKREFSLMKSPTFSIDDNNEESPDNNNSSNQIAQKLALKFLGNQQKLLEIFYSYDYQDIFPRNQLEIMMKSLEIPQEIKKKNLINESQNYVFELLFNEINCGINEKEFLNTKTTVVASFKQIKLEFEEKSRLQEQMSSKLSKIPFTLNENQQKKLNCEENLMKSTKNLALLETFIGSLREILNISMEMAFPYFSNEISLIEFRFNLIIYIVFLLKYPSFYRRLFLQKVETLLIVNKDFHLLDYPIFSSLRDYGLEDLEYRPFPFNFLNIIAIIEVLNEFRELPLVIIDPNDMYIEFLKRNKARESMIIEEICEDAKTNENILESIEKGRVLVIKDCDKGLFSMIQPIMKWNLEEILEKILKNSLRNEKSQISNPLEIEPTIEILGKTLKIHKNFRLLLIFQNEEFLRSSFPEILMKSLIIFTDIEDKSLWDQTIALKLSQKLETVERRTLLEKLFMKTSNHFSENEILYQDFLQEFKKLSSIQEIPNIEKLKFGYSTIRSKFFEDFSRLIRKSPENMKKSVLNKDYRDIYKEIKRFVQRNAIKRPMNLLEVKDKQKYQGLIDFIHVVKLTNYSLIQVIGNIYSFNDYLYMDILDQTLLILKDNSIEYPVFYNN